MEYDSTNTYYKTVLTRSKQAKKYCADTYSKADVLKKYTRDNDAFSMYPLNTRSRINLK